MTCESLKDRQKQRSSAYLEPMMQLFEQGMIEGGDLLSIESTGGKRGFGRSADDVRHKRNCFCTGRPRRKGYAVSVEQNCFP